MLHESDTHTRARRHIRGSLWQRVHALPAIVRRADACTSRSQLSLSGLRGKSLLACRGFCVVRARFGVALHDRVSCGSRLKVYI